METHIHGGRLESTMKAKKEFEVEDEDDETMDEEEEEEEENEEESEECRLKRKKMDPVRVGSGKKGLSGAVPAAAAAGGGIAPLCCQADKCGSYLTFAKTYHKRHKVCEFHAKALAVLLNGVDQRFCQQCSRFHEVAEFDGTKRSCRRRLAGHNERRRKASSESRGEGSSRRRLETPLKESKQCNQMDGRGGGGGRGQLIISGNSNFHIA